MFRFTIRLCLVFFSFQALFRLFFYLFFRDIAPSETGALHIFQAFFMGLGVDLMISFLIALPLAFLFKKKRFHSGFKIKGLSFFSSAICSLLLLLFIVNLLYYDFFLKHVSFASLQYFLGGGTSLSAIWEGFSVIPIGFLTLGIGFVFYFIFRKLVFNKKSFPKVYKFNLSVLLLIILGNVFLGVFRSSADKNVLAINHFTASLSSHPLSHFFDSVLSFSLAQWDGPFSRERMKATYPQMREYFGLKGEKTKAFPSLERPVKRSQLRFSKNTNVVVIISESLANHKTGLFGNPMNPTPEFDDLAKKGHLFTQFYVPLHTTARSFFAFLTGLPDIELPTNASRNPLLWKQKTLLSEFSNHEKYYITNGDANWANIKTLIDVNTPNVHFFDQSNMGSMMHNAWGLSDLDMFKAASDILSRSKKPFFAILQTVSYHSPYTIPVGVDGFEKKEISLDEIKDYGFISSKSYNALRFADFSLGHFMRDMKKKDFYNNTVFVIFGDHGTADRNAVQVPKGEIVHGLSLLHVPFVIYSHKMKAKVISKMASELDVLPTLLGALGYRALNTTLGRDLYSHYRDDYIPVFFHREPSFGVGLLGQEFFLRGNILEGPTGLYKYKSLTPEEDVKNLHFEQFQKMSQMAFGFYEFSRYLILNN